MTTAAARAADYRPSVAEPSRLLVTRRDPRDRSYQAIGFLMYDGSDYRFAYLRELPKSPHLRVLPGLPEVTRSYRSARLFPIFAERVISARRPDRAVSLEALGLPVEAGPFEILQRSGGRRVGDSIEVVPAPVAGPDGSIGIDFLAHGVRYQPPDNQDRISRLRSGERLRIVPDPDNEKDERALFVTDSDAVSLGWVPNPLLDLVHAIIDPVVTVVRANGPEVGFHLRLLVRVAGHLPAGCQPFSGAGWETVD